jgi:glycosyltransferase involved in cell wall biosynthesis
LVVVELSRKKTIAAYMVADLFLFPSNIECSPLVLFECMASKTPFLATDVGNVKEIIAWSNSGRLLPTLKLNNGLRIADVEKSVDFLEEFFSDKEDLQLKSFTGFEAFTNNYSWDIISKNYETLYKSCISKIL